MGAAIGARVFAWVMRNRGVAPRCVVVLPHCLRMKVGALVDRSGIEARRNPHPGQGAQRHLGPEQSSSAGRKYSHHVLSLSRLPRSLTEGW